MLRHFLLFIVSLSACTLSLAQDVNNWANWRGPNYDGSVEGANPPWEWSQDKNIQWKTAVPGKGSSSPIVWGDRIYLATAIETDREGQPDLRGVPLGPGGAPSGAAPGPTRQGFRGLQRGPGSEAPPAGADASQGGQRRGGPPGGPRGAGGPGGMNAPIPTHYFQFVVLAYDRNNGKEVWRSVLNEAVPFEGGHPTNTFASGSPVTDGRHVFVSFGSFGVYCLDLDGNRVWSADLGRMRTRNAFGEASTPALHGDTLIVPWDQDGWEDKNGNGQRDDDELLSSLVALNAKTGEVKWRTARPTEVTTWATPLIVEHAGRTQVVTNGSVVRSYDLGTGQLLWECGGQVSNPIPSPIRLNDAVICMTGYRGNAIYSMALDSSGKIDETDKVNWSRTDAAPYVASATLYKGQLYLTKERDGIMTAVDATTGEVIIPQTRITGVRDIYASPVSAADRIYFTSREGVTTVIRHGSQYEELAVNKLGEPVDASPAISGNQIFIRAAEHLYCIAE